MTPWSWARVSPTTVYRTVSDNGVTLKSRLGIVQVVENGTSIESLGTVSYSHSIVIIALSCIISETGRKSTFFYAMNSTTLLGYPRRNTV